MSKYDTLPDGTDPLSFYRPSVAPSPYDPRDYRLTLAGEPLPAAPSAYAIPEWDARNQADWGSCMAFAAAAAIEIELRNAGYGHLMDVSEQFLYALGREIQNWLCQNQGTYPRDLMKVLCDVGVVLEVDAPYQSQGLCWTPDTTMRTQAYRIRGQSYVNAGSLEGARAAIAANHGVVCALVLPNNFQPDAAGRLPLPSGGPWGGHAMLFTAYSDVEQYIDPRNSWSNVWGRRGYGRLPYAYFDSARVGQHAIWSNDLWFLTGVIVEGADPEPEPEPEPQPVQTTTYLRRFDRVNGGWQWRGDIPGDPPLPGQQTAIAFVDIDANGERLASDWWYPKGAR